MDTKSLLALVEVAARAIASEPIGSPKTQAIAVGVVSLLEITRALREQAASLASPSRNPPAGWPNRDPGIVYGSGVTPAPDDPITPVQAPAGVQSVPVAPAQQQ